MSGDHNMYQKPRSYVDDEAQVQAMIKKAVREERQQMLDFIEEFYGAEQNRNDMFSEGYDYALYHMEQFVKGSEKRDGQHIFKGEIMNREEMFIALEALEKDPNVDRMINADWAFNTLRGGLESTHVVDLPDLARQAGMLVQEVSAQCTRFHGDLESLDSVAFAISECKLNHCLDMLRKAGYTEAADYLQGVG